MKVNIISIFIYYQYFYKNDFINFYDNFMMNKVYIIYYKIYIGVFIIILHKIKNNELRLLFHYQKIKIICIIL